MTDAAALQEHALEVATKAARNIGGTVREVAHRVKSQAYLFGQLRHSFPEASEQAIRDALYWLRHNAPDAAFVPTDRAPTKGREQSSDPVWLVRATRLADLFNVPLEPEAVLLRAETRLRWKRNFTIQTLAAAEDLELIEYVDGHWRWPEPAEQPAPTVAMNTTVVKPEDPMTVTDAAEAAPTPAAPAAPPPMDPPETPEQRKRRQKREAEHRYRAKKRKCAPKPRLPTPAAPALPLPAAASADSTLDAVLEQRVRALVRAELRAELTKTISELLSKALVAA